MRGSSYEEFAANVASVKGLLDPPGQPPATNQPRSPATAQATPEGWCMKHGLQMQRNQKEGRSWWSHKTAEGSCKGK
jgi:hypothetical protein